MIKEDISKEESRAALDLIISKAIELDLRLKYLL